MFAFQWREFSLPLSSAHRKKRVRRRCNYRGIPPQPSATRIISQWASSLEWCHAVTLHILVGKICISFFLFYSEGMLSLVVLWLCLCNKLEQANNYCRMARNLAAQQWLLKCSLRVVVVDPRGSRHFSSPLPSWSDQQPPRDRPIAPRGPGQPNMCHVVVSGMGDSSVLDEFLEWFCVGMRVGLVICSFKHRPTLLTAHKLHYLRVLVCNNAAVVWKAWRALKLFRSVFFSLNLKVGVATYMHTQRAISTKKKRFITG